MTVERTNRIINLKDTEKVFNKFDIFLYRKNSGLANREVKQCELNRLENKYYFILNNGEEVPTLCPKCQAGNLFINEYRCINPDDFSDEFWLELTTCNNRHQCDFVSAENIPIKFGNKLVQSKLEAIEKRKETINEKKEYYKNLDQYVKDDSWNNVLKAVFRKSPKVVVGSVVTIILVTLVAVNSLAGNVSQKISAKLFGQEVNYEVENK